VDASKFPPRVLLDTGVLIRALEHDQDAHEGDARVKDCRDLWVALLRSDRTDVLISALTVLELMRGDAAPVLPILPGIVLASFDYRAAQDMSKWATPQVIAGVREASGSTRRVTSYDALIVGTARAYHADCIVSYDKDVKSLAPKAGIACHEPSHFRADPTLFGGKA
jgi:predicted nucleic acid-binding protein